MLSSCRNQGAPTYPAPGHHARKPEHEVRPEWDAHKVKALREYLSYTQQRLPEELGTRQQTISEWETGQYRPRGATVTLLNIAAERAGFEYSGNIEGDGDGDKDANI